MQGLSDQPDVLVRAKSVVVRHRCGDPGGAQLRGDPGRVEQQGLQLLLPPRFAEMMAEPGPQVWLLRRQVGPGPGGWAMRVQQSRMQRRQVFGVQLQEIQLQSWKWIVSCPPAWTRDSRPLRARSANSARLRCGERRPECAHN